MSITIRISPVEIAKLKLAMDTFGKKVSDAQAKVVAKYTLLVEAEAKRRAPVATGRLRASIHHILSRAGSNAVQRITQGFVRDGVDYGIHQEYGTRFHGAQPFLRPALLKYQDAFIKELKEAIEDAAKSTGLRFA